MSSQVSEISPVLVEVKVEVPWATVQKDMEDGYTRAARTARIKGFRPGKVPRSVVKQMYGAQVRNEVLTSLIEKGLWSAIEEHSIAAVATPSVEPSPMKDGEPLSFTAKVEVRPKLDKIDLDGLEIMRASSEVSDEDVNKEVERMRDENATIAAPASARPAKAGDLLTIDYLVAIDGVGKADMTATDRPVELGQDRLLPEFEKGLIGANVGDIKTIEVAFADDHGNDDLKGKKAEFKVTVKEIKEKVLPELDDEFAKDCGPFQTLLELRLDIRKKLEDAAKQKSDSGLRDQVVERLVDKNEVPVPPSLLQQEEQSMMRDLAGFMQMTGQGGKDMPMSEELHGTVHGRAERKVRAALLLGEIARREKMSVTKEEFEARLAQIAERSGKHIAKVRVEYQGERGERLESQLLEGKLLDYLMTKAVIKDAPAGGEASTEAAPATESKATKKMKTKKAEKTE